MSNHNPTITSSNATGSFSENANTTGSNALHNLSGTMNFKDSDHNDTHTTSASLKTATLSSGTIIPATTLAHLNSAMSSSILTDNNGSGKLKWSFSAEDDDFDFLSKNQSLTLKYEVTLSDNHGGTTKKLVTVTITGTDDKPVIDFGTQAILSEQAGQTLSFSHDTAQIAVHFTDVDLTNTGHTATVIDASASGATGGLLPGFLGELELRSFFHIDNVVKASGSSNGTINTTFSAPDLAFDYLSEGETVDITYTIRLNDNAGGITNQTVMVIVVGTNDGPVFISHSDTENLTEGEDLSSGQLTASGDLCFADIDLSDTHSVSTTATATRSGGGGVPLNEAELLAALSTSLDDSTGHVFGEVDWAFALDNSDVSFLNSGETLTITYEITVTDDAGATTTRTVTIEILGTNDPVVVTSDPQSALLAEFADTTGSAAQNTTTTDSLFFTDTDIGDTHTVAVAVDSAVWSGGPAIPAATETGLGTALLTVLNDSTGTGSGSIDWTFSIADQDLDFLAADEFLTVTYEVSVSDGPTSASQTVTITVDGANDAVVVTGPAGLVSITEFAATSGSFDPNPSSPATGTMAFTDVDLSDVHSVQAIVSSFAYSGGPDIPPDTFNDLMTALQTTLFNDSTGSGSGSVDWSFSIPDRDLDFLGDSETLIVTYDVVVSDGFTSSSQTVTITATGAPDDLTVNPATGAILDTAATDTGSIVAFGNVITDAGDNGGDLGVTLSVTDVNGSAGNVGNFVAGVYGDLILFEDGSYFYVANASLDPLQVGEPFPPADEVFTFTVTDSLGRFEETTLTLSVSGADDAAVITAADAFGSVTEDAGPTAIVNGNFETGDFTGWTFDGAPSVQFLALGGGFGNYSVVLAAPVGILTQDIATVAGQHYTLSFVVSGDPDSNDGEPFPPADNTFTASWDGNTVLSTVDNFGGFTTYTFDVEATDDNSTLSFSYTDNGFAMYLDQVFVAPTTGPTTETADGSIAFTDIETGDHEASFFPVGDGYLGSFTLDEVSEAGGSGSVDWHFTVDNADIQFLGAGDSLTQTYFVLIAGEGGGASVAQSVDITINGANDAPTTVGADHVITDAGADGGIFIPSWVLTANDIDPDSSDTLTVNAITSTSGSDAFLFGGVIWFDDATLDGSFDYNTTDGTAVSAGSGTVTVDNNLASTTTLDGTGGDDIIIAAVGGEALNGGGGNDVLIGNSGSHVLTGGSGDDIFAFELVPDQGLTPTNSITDFDNVTDHDMIAISASAFGGGLTAGMDVSSVFESSGDAEFFTGTAVFHYDTTADILYFSADGTTASALVVAQLQPGVALNPNDLLIT